jgi:hypothetical protein
MSTEIEATVVIQYIDKLRHFFDYAFIHISIAYTYRTLSCGREGHPCSVALQELA